MNYKTVSPKDFDFNPFTKIGSDWMLVSACDSKGSFNTMTASWGGVGVLWNKNVFFCFVRPQRYTREFIDDSNHITLSFFDEDKRDSLALCGRKSGRDCDKIKEARLTPTVENEKVFFEEARVTLVGKKLFRQEMTPDSFIDTSLIDKNYPLDDFHITYICEIEEIRVAI